MIGKALLSGLAGAATLTVINEAARRILPHAPRVEVIGMRAVARPMSAMGIEPPHRPQLYKLTLAGALLADSLWYGLVAVGKPEKAWNRGVVLGLLGGLGAVMLPSPLGLGRQPHQRSPITETLTIAWYLAGGLAAAAVASELLKPEAAEATPRNEYKTPQPIRSAEPAAVHP